MNYDVFNEIWGEGGKIKIAFYPSILIVYFSFYELSSVGSLNSVEDKGGVEFDQNRTRYILVDRWTNPTR
jgi:hypothetical protein